MSRTQVFIGDCLPLAVCLDCCLLLNQCSQFYEKTNQAQCSLRNLIELKKEEEDEVQQEILQSTLTAPTIESDAAEPAEKADDFDKDDDDYADDSVGGIDDDYFDDSSDKIESQESTNDCRADKCGKIVGKESSPKLNSETEKKKVKRKGACSPKLDNLLVRNNSSSDGGASRGEARSSAKIPENYMTG